MSGEIYGVRGPDPRNTVAKAPGRREAEEMLLDGEVLVWSVDGGKNFTEVIDTIDWAAPSYEEALRMIQAVNRVMLERGTQLSDGLVLLIDEAQALRPGRDAREILGEFLRHGREAGLAPEIEEELRKLEGGPQ